MKKKLFVLLTCPEKKENKNISLYCDHLYIKAITKAGGIPIVIAPPYTEIKDEIMDIGQALVLTGGEDIDPIYYKEKQDPKTKGVDRERDKLEIELLKKAVDKNLPVLGICRGLQVINVAYGGTLYQDLPSHPYDKDHNIIIEKNSFLDKIFQKEKIRVNSYHHQAAKKVAPGFLPIAKTEDGIIESIILKDEKKFVLGVQWHPERSYDKFEGLFKEFIKIAGGERL